MSKPTVQQIKDLMKKQNYKSYKVNDARSFTHLLPYKNEADRIIPLPIKNTGESTDEYSERKREWLRTYITEEGCKIYEAAKGSKPAGHSLPNPLAKTFVNARARTSHDKSAECSNFARHAIGTLIQNKDITDNYNIVFAGIMSDMHNIAILVPKDATLTLKQIENQQQLVGNLPEGSLIIDPWAFAMGHPFDKSFGCSPREFTFSGSLKEIKVHYQSKNDATVHTVQEKATPNDPSMSGGGSKEQTTNIKFTDILPVPQQHKAMLANFDSSLEKLKIHTQGLADRGYPSAAAEAQKAYNTLVEARNDLISQNFTPSSRQNFVETCNKGIEKAQKGELKDARGFSQIFFYLAKAIATVFTLGMYSKQTESINKMNDLKAALVDIKSKDESTNEQRPAP